MTTITDDDRLWASDWLCIGFHDEFCEYDGMEGETAVCAGERRNFAEKITGVAPQQRVNE